MSETKTETQDTIEGDALRGEVRGILAGEGKSQADLARESGVAYGTFTGWLASTYAGNNAKIEEKIGNWLQARSQNATMAASLPTSPRFQLTATSERIVSLLQWAKVAGDTGIVVGVPGVGKSTTFKQFTSTNPNVWMVTLEPCTKGINQVLVRLCEAMGVTEKRPTYLSTAIGQFVRDKDGLIIIDEAQHASMDALDQIRCIPDQYSCGVVLGGHQSVFARLRNGSDGNYAQLTSRVGMRLTLSKPRRADIDTLLKAWTVEDKDIAKQLHFYAGKPGALRVIDKVMKLAHLLAIGAGEDLQLKHIKAAYSQLAHHDQTDNSA